MAIVANVNAGLAQYACALGVDPGALHETYRERLEVLIAPDRTSHGLWENNVLGAEKADVSAFPVPTHYPMDGGAYLTAAMVVARDPISGIETLGYHRCQVKGRNKLGISLHSRRRMFEYFRQAEASGHDLPAAICLGLNPAFAMGALAHPGKNVSKFDIIGGVLGEPLRIAPCKTIDLDVPACAEIVVEGRIVAGIREPEGPFGEFTGYFSGRSTENVFEISGVNTRGRPWFQAIGAGRVSDHLWSLALPREVEIRRQLARAIPGVVGVSVPTWGCGSFAAIVAIRQSRPGEAKQVIPIVFGADHNIKLVIVVDDDVEVSDTEQVLWAVCTRMQAQRDLLTMNGMLGALLEPSSDEEGLTSKLGIDATKPFGEVFPLPLRLPSESEVRAEEIVRKLR
jgi:UbiD family decarboxylase